MEKNMSSYQQLIAISRYARWNGTRRETWEDTVDRYMLNVVEKFINKDQNLYKKIRKYIINLEILPSMRGIMTAGDALNRDNIAIYNCSYLPIDDLKCFDETMYILMCGTGVGFSVEKENVDKLPIIAEEFTNTDTVIKVADTKIGWATALREFISLLYSGKIPKYDVSKIRKKGERLKTFGGRASGPEPLISLFDYLTNVFKKAAGRKLNTLEVHGIMCKIGEVVVVGGVRRSALISLSDLEDNNLRFCKSGQWVTKNPEFRLANNSAVYKEKPELCSFIDEWKAIYSSKSGERGILNRNAVKKKIALSNRRNPDYNFGTNPCGEIALRPYGLCNLTEIVVKEYDTKKTLKEKAILATILGTIQSTFSDFKYLRKIWKNNAEEERLLGVSITGIFDNPLTYSITEDTAKFLRDLKNITIKTNEEWAKKLNINQSTSITCIKPSGTVSQLANSSGGIHPRHSKYYIRTIRQNNNDPLTDFLKDQKVPHEKCLYDPENTTIFSFPIKSPEFSKTRNEITPLGHLDLWRMYNENWAEHQVSITVNIPDEDWLEVASYVYKHFDKITGISFLPYDGGTYKQAPYTECSRDEYEKLNNQFPCIKWNEFFKYETVDNTTGSQELACVAGGCEI